MEERMPRKLAVILHADVVDSTTLVRQNETLAHERIQRVFHDFSETIKDYGGIPHELRGDALIAEFHRASDALSAALAFQSKNAEFNLTLEDEIKTQIRVGIGMGEVVIADNTITGAGVVLAQRLEQLAEPDGVCIQGAAYETVPQRLPFAFNSLGERRVKGFPEPVRAFSAALKSGEAAPAPEPNHTASAHEPVRSKLSWLAAGVLGLVILAGGTLLWRDTFEPRDSAESTKRLPPPPPDLGRKWERSKVKAGRMNIMLELPARWDARVLTKQTDETQERFEFGVEAGSQMVIAEDKENIADLRIFKVRWRKMGVSVDESHEWMQSVGADAILSQYAGGAGYKEDRGSIKKGSLGSGEEVTMIPSVLKINNEARQVRIAYAIRGKADFGQREFIVFFFHNTGTTQEISDETVALILWSVKKMF